MTFSILALDADTGEIGIAVQSNELAIGASVPWAKVTAGAFVAQSLGAWNFGPRALDMLAEGKAPFEVIRSLVEHDQFARFRQLGALSKSGEAATYTGDGCREWAGAVGGKGYCCLGNSLAGPGVVDQMAAALLSSAGKLAERLLAALDAGQAAGGDKRGMQSAALLVVRECCGFSGPVDRYIDLRVDDHLSPISELRRIFELRQAIIRRWNR